jgi:hypothetical protein
MTYGYEVKGRQDRKLDVSRQLSEFGNKIPTSAMLLLNAFPFSMYSLICAAYQKLTYHHYSSALYPRLGAIY